VEDDNMVPLKHLSINLAPNPVNSFANISLKVDTASEVRIEVYDLKGRKLSSIFYGMVGSGEHIVSWNAADSKLASGVYLLKASSVYDTVVQKILLVK
jgi:flagellar hook assembly protein FlgD